MEGQEIPLEILLLLRKGSL